MKIFIVYYAYSDYMSGDVGDEVYAFESKESAKNKVEKLHKEKILESFTSSEIETAERYEHDDEHFSFVNEDGYSNFCSINEVELEK